MNTRTSTTGELKDGVQQVRVELLETKGRAEGRLTGIRPGQAPFFGA
ncbi:hypothetical protein ACFWJ5_07880 [Streptomyces qaidamensis]